jgi:hypothetical protein
MLPLHIWGTLKPPSVLLNVCPFSTRCMFSIIICKRRHLNFKLPITLAGDVTLVNRMPSTSYPRALLHINDVSSQSPWAFDRAFNNNKFISVVHQLGLRVLLELAEIINTAWFSCQFTSIITQKCLEN